MQLPSVGRQLRTMNFPREVTNFFIFLNFVIIIKVSCGTPNSTLKGCAFEPLPEDFSIEPASTPLHIGADIRIVGLRKESGSGDSFGVDVELVYLIDRISLAEAFKLWPNVSESP